MTGSRIRGMLLGATAALAALLLLAWSQSWYELQLVENSGADVSVLMVGGDVAASGLVPLALTTLALVAALAIAGPVFRRILGVLQALVGASIVAVVLVTTADPIASSATAITDATGISGRDSVAELVASVAGSAWPVVAVVLGVLVIATGLLVVLTAGRWPVSGRKYTRTRLVAADDSSQDAVAEWDALSDGDDPTAADR